MQITDINVMQDCVNINSTGCVLVSALCVYVCWGGLCVCAFHYSGNQPVWPVVEFLSGCLNMLWFIG